MINSVEDDSMDIFDIVGVTYPTFTPETCPSIGDTLMFKGKIVECVEYDLRLGNLCGICPFNVDFEYCGDYITCSRLVGFVEIGKSAEMVNPND